MPLDGTHCPTCGQFCKVYKRSINAPMARALIVLVRTSIEDDHEWVNLPRALEARGIAQGGGDAAKLRYWGLILPMPGEREDGSWRTGWWKPTPLGISFALDRARVRKYARVYNKECFELFGEPISIRDALDTKFDYAEIMGWWGS